MAQGRPKKRVEEEHGEENSERWLLTYADMITLLLALFIVLFATSTISTKKFIALALGFKAAFNPTPGLQQGGQGLLQQANLQQAAGSHPVNANSINPVHAPTTAVPSTITGQPQTTSLSVTGTLAAQALAKIQGQLEQALAAKGLTGTVSTSVSARGLIVQILADTVFFETNSAALGAQGDLVVDTIASVLSSDQNQIEVEGYTDDQPVTGPPYYSNLELSAIRAVDVAQRLTTVDSINQDRVFATGYGPNDSIVPNDNPTDMAMNRRMDVVILPTGAQGP
jgi:chemotaxis protein MotB